MPRNRLTRTSVTTTAAALVDEHGWDELTLAAVANALDVRTPSLYNHIEGLDDLRSTVAALATRRLGERLQAAAIGVHRTEALRAVADAYRSFARAHPGLYRATLRAPDPSDSEHHAAAASVMKVVSAVVHGYGLGEGPTIDVVRALRAALHGWCDLERSGAFGLPRSVDHSYEAMIDGFDHALSDFDDALTDTDPAPPISPN